MAVEVLFTLLSFVGVFLLGPLAVRYCTKWELVAKVVERSAHTIPTPHGGGFLILLITWPLLMALNVLSLLEHQAFWYGILFAALPLVWMSVLDDIKPRSPLLRLCVHTACVTVGVMLLPPLFDLVPVWAEKLILIFAWTWFLNLYNFMDGLDGLATSEAVFLGLALLFFVPGVAPVAAVMAAATLAFLRVNWHPARVFLGDIGSIYLGFIFGGLLLISLEWDTWRLVYPLFTITLVFSGDATYTLFKRMAGGHKPWIPHREFWFHRAALAGYRHTQVVGRAWLLNAGLFGIAVVGYSLNLGPITLLLGLALMGLAAWRIKKLEMNKR